MSLSKEVQEYHLTPKGWVRGSFRGDSLGGKDELPIPNDRVLTIKCIDELTSAFSKPNYYDKIVWESEDKQLVKKFKSKWGKKPEWFGYKMKN